MGEGEGRGREGKWEAAGVGEGSWEVAGGKGEENGGSRREGRRKWRLEEVREDKGKRETERKTREREEM